MTVALDIQNLSIDYLTESGEALHAVENVSFQVQEGRSLALVGKSGCGKTTTMLGLLRLLPEEGRITSGKMMYRDVDLLQLSEEQMRQYRWNHIALVFQGAMNALNPVRKVGDQIAEAITNHQLLGKKDAQTTGGRTDGIGGDQPGTSETVSAPVQRGDAPTGDDCDGAGL